MISVVCPKTTKRCNLLHFLAPFPQNCSKDPLISKSYQAVSGKNPSPAHLSSEGKVGHPALMGQVSLRLVTKDGVLKVIKSSEFLKLSCLRQMQFQKSHKQISDGVGQNWRQDPNIASNTHTERWTELLTLCFCLESSRSQTRFSIETSSLFRMRYWLLNGQALPGYSLNLSIFVQCKTYA